ncbi:MAG: CamS family sex pheromone protein [Limosilactobacillus gorillae]|uniref:CamS family sex pheromone protein n=1 Tax=Limosilactobacillus gorillae TaxID=1450649 RepID=UPI000A8FC814|nr:CamS family sex pheromone protein [Limosilactobacillus gorillae]MDO4855656.1 CamS family sex pheromone protein [Limosilactobacillus gorillae]
MRVKKIVLAAALTMVAAVTLAGCGKKSSSVTTTGSTSGNYQGVIEDGRYKTSKARGVNTAQNSNVNNLKAFEAGLTNVSKQVFSTKSYIFQEGQYLSSGTLENWLGRKTSSNPTGLNPAKGKSSDPNPVYIQQIEEQDYMQQSGDSLKLKGIVIGIGVNSEYTYQKTTGGPNYTKDISDAEVQKQGKLAAQKILKRLRERKSLKNVPIVIALFKQAPDDSLVGGTFFAYSKNDGDTISSWKSLNYKAVVLPKASDATSNEASDQSDNSNFTNFKTQIQSFFPNLSGVTAQAEYQNNSLSGMNITVTTQFYSQTEIQSFTEYILQAAKKYLPSGIPIEIKIESSNGIQAVVFRNSGSSSYQVHVFGAY